MRRPTYFFPITQKKIKLVPEATPALKTKQPVDESQLIDSYTFDNFIEGSGNEFAKMVALTIAETTGKIVFNPFLIYGPTGVGKTHLLQALGNHVKSKWTARKISFVSSKAFATKFLYAIRTNTTEEFRNLYRKVDLLLLDGIQDFANKWKTQEELLHTFDELHRKNRQIVLSSDKPPNKLIGLEERLISRFNGGLITDIQPPDLETRIAILQKKCEEKNVELPFEIGRFIADAISSNITELERAFIRMVVRSSLYGKDITLELAQSVVEEINIGNLTIETIQKTVCKYFEIEEDLIKAKTKKKEIVQARQIAMYLAKKLTDNSSKMIGFQFGRRDRHTVVHACGLIENLMKNDENFREIIGKLERNMKISRS